MARECTVFRWCLFWTMLVGCSAATLESRVSEQREDKSPSVDRHVSHPAMTTPKMHAPNSSSDEYTLLRTRMVEQQLRRRGIRDQRVLESMAKVPRHLYVPSDLLDSAYEDNPQPIGYGQTISQPYIVALMAEIVRPKPGDRALDIGTGCGYQAAVLAELVHEVFSIEIVEPLAIQAQQRLAELGYRNIQVRHGDGYRGWLEKSPFDIIVVAAAPERVPQPLIDQLAPGGRLIIPVGLGSQNLKLLEKDRDGRMQETLVAAVRFVPMTGEAEEN
jgi:protein-L-isoaspartate(D-aspartate) O-methyltransferase